MGKEMKRQWQKPNPALKELEILVGEWDMEGYHPQLPAPVRGHASFGWLEGGAFFYWRPSYEQPGPPSGIAVVGRDGSEANYCLLYFDERGVSRIYQMSFGGKIWKLWRESPSFSQRMTATVSDDLSQIVLHGELSRDGINWEQDLDLTFTKVG